MGAKDKVRVGLVGVGWIGAHHGANLLNNPHAELAGVCDPDQDKAKAFLQRRMPGWRTCSGSRTSRPW
jgi:predicted dehydrogenase